MIDAETQMRQAEMTAHEWFHTIAGDRAEELNEYPTVVAARLVACGLDELAMSNRMIAENLERIAEAIKNAQVQ
tara:strand:- start:679 stop:900 length:222 start_codon:yes stop_codon:yes gene_type:complete